MKDMNKDQQEAGGRGSEYKLELFTRQMSKTAKYNKNRNSWNNLTKIWGNPGNICTGSGFLWMKTAVLITNRKLVVGKALETWAIEDT